MDAITITAIATCVAGIAALITAIILAVQTGAFAAAAKANALAARIEYYYAQIQTHKDSAPKQRRLEHQQVHLVYQLDEVLHKLRVGVGRRTKFSPHNAKVPHWDAEEYKTKGRTF